MSEIETRWTDNPVCPHCGDEQDDWWDGLTEKKNDGDSWQTECGNCEKEFTVTMNASYSFCTATTTE